MAKPMSGGKRSYRPIHLLSYSMGEYYPYESGACEVRGEMREVQFSPYIYIEGNPSLHHTLRHTDPPRGGWGHGASTGGTGTTPQIYVGRQSINQLEITWIKKSYLPSSSIRGHFFIRPGRLSLLSKIFTERSSSNRASFS